MSEGLSKEIAKAVAAQDEAYTKSLASIDSLLQDVDSIIGMKWHYVSFNIPAFTTRLPHAPFRDRTNNY